MPRALIGCTHVRAERAEKRVAAAARRVAKDDAMNEMSARAAHIHRIAGDESQPLLEHYEAINRTMSVVLGTHPPAPAAPPPPSLA